jgi:hypothetical protein
MTSNLCGCRQCGGPEARARAILARRVVLYAPFVRARYSAATPTVSLRNRTIRPSLYSRLVLAVARDETGDMR